MPRDDDWIKVAAKQSACEFREEVLDLRDLKIYRLDEYAKGYQRPLNTAWVDKHDQDGIFDASEARTIFVSERRDGSFWVLDGQHTMELLMRRGITHWICRVFMGLTAAQEAHRFQEYQKNSQPLSPVVQWQAEVVSGQVPAVTEIERVLEKHRLRISNTKLRVKEGYVQLGIRGVLETVHKYGGADLVDATIQVCVDAWGLERSSFNGRIFAGIGYLLAYSTIPVDRDRLVAALSNTTPLKLQDEIQSTGSGGQGRKAAFAIVEQYRMGVPGTDYDAIRSAKLRPRFPVPGKGEEYVARRSGFFAEPEEPATRVKAPRARAA